MERFRIKMTRTTTGHEVQDNGVISAAKRFEEGRIYSVDEDLMNCFLQLGVAELLDTEKLEAVKAEREAAELARLQELEAADDEEAKLRKQDVEAEAGGQGEGEGETSTGDQAQEGSTEEEEGSEADEGDEGDDEEVIEDEEKD